MFCSIFVLVCSELFFQILIFNDWCKNLIVFLYKFCSSLLLIQQFSFSFFKYVVSMSRLLNCLFKLVLKFNYQGLRFYVYVVLCMLVMMSLFLFKLWKVCVFLISVLIVFFVVEIFWGLMCCVCILSIFCRKGWYMIICVFQ